MCKEKIYYFYTLRSDDFPEDVRYVGVTTQTLNQRFSEHKYKATSEKFRSQPVHKWMYSKFKQDIGIQIKYLDECCESFWEEREKYWIKFYKDSGANLLNLQLGGNGVITKEMRNIYGRTRSILAHQIPVAAYDKVTGDEIMRFISGVEAAKYFNVEKTTINSALDKPNRSSCGYIWKRLPKNELIKNSPKNKDYNKRIEVYQYDLDGNFVKKYLSVRQVYREFLGVSKSYGTSTFRSGILNSNKIWHNYVWCTENFKIDYYKVFPYAILDSEGTVIKKFVTRTDIAKYLQVDLSTIKKYINNQQPLKFKNNIIIIKY